MIARFVRGGSRLDIASSPYAPGGDFFLLPEIAAERVYSEGGGTNRYGGADLVDERYTNRDWSFSVKVSGTSVEAVRAGITRLADFLAGRTPEPYPLYLEYSGSDLPEPSWGTFGCPVRLEILSATVSLGQEYTIASARETSIFVHVRAVVAPFALMKPQRVCNASGAIIENKISPVRGVTVGISTSGTQNLVTNPVFSNSSYLTGWAAGTGLTVSRNTDPEYILPGATNSALITSLNQLGRNIQTSVVTTAGTYTVAFFGKKNVQPGEAWDNPFMFADGTTPAIQIFVNGTAYSDFVTNSLGDGYYVAARYGNYLPAGTETVGVWTTATTPQFYLCGANVHKPFYNYPDHFYPQTWGDCLGVGWTGAAHNSASTADHGMLSLPMAGILRADRGAAYFAWRCDGVEGNGGNEKLLHFGGPYMQYVPTSGTGLPKIWAYGFGTTMLTVETGTADIYKHIVLTWGTAGTRLFCNGTLLGTSDFSVPGTFGPNLSIMNDSSKTVGLFGSCMGLMLYDKELTTAEAQAVMAQGQSLTDSGYGVSPLPYFWTRDWVMNDYILWNYNDPTGLNNYGVYGFLPGNYPCIVEMAGTQSAAVNNHFGIYPGPAYYSPEQFYDYRIGTSTGTINVGTSDTRIGSVSITSAGAIRDVVLGHDWSAFVRMAEETASAGTVSLRASVKIGGQEYFSAYTGTVLTNGTANLYRAGPVGAPPADGLFIENSFNVSPSAELHLYAKRTAGTGNMSVSFTQFLPNDLTRITDSTLQGFIIKGREAKTSGTAWTGAKPADTFEGHIIEFTPGQYNHLVSIIGAPGAAHTLLNKIKIYTYVIPRWSLL